MKKRILLLMFILFSSILGVGYSNYIIANFYVNGYEENLNIGGENEDNVNYKKVEFYDTSGTLIKKMYVKNNDKLSIEETPFLYDNSGNYYIWKDENNTVYFNPNDPNDKNALKKEITVNKELILKPEARYVQTPQGNNFNESIGSSTINDNRVAISGNGNTYNFNEVNENCESGNTSTTPAAIIELDNGFYNDLNLSFNFKADKDQYVADLPNFEREYLPLEIRYRDYMKYQANGDTTISLEDPTSSSSDFKPTAGSSTNGKNYCISKVVLGRDTILSNTSVLTIGAFTSFYGSNDEYSQYNWQGFITGPYSELDLNGNTLIVSDGSGIEAYGTITDSSPDKTGKIIMKNGSTLTATFVVEDHHHESGAPMNYNYSDSFFKMYRCPYINVPIIFEKGSKFLGNMKLDWGADNSNYSLNKINLIGSSDLNSSEKYLLNTYNSPDDSYILREVTYDTGEGSLKEVLSKSSNKTAYNNIMYQRIGYTTYNCDIQLQLPNNLNVKMSLGEISANMNKSPWYIPPYFDFNLQATSITILNQLNFMPGSSMYGDKNSTIRLSYTAEQSISKFGSGDLKVPSQYFVATGGLTFINELYDFTDAGKYIDNSDFPGSYTSSTCTVYSGMTSFRTYVNKKPAHLDFYGKFAFDNFDDKTKLQNYTNNSLKYNLGGNINIYDLDDFKGKIDNANDKVLLYSKSFKSGPNRLTEAYKIVITYYNGDSYRFNITDYFFLPLVSNGNVLFDIKNNYLTRVRDDYLTSKITYDFGLGIVQASNISYGYFPVDNSNNYLDYELLHVNKAQYSSISDFYKGLNDLDGGFYRINYNSSTGIATVVDSRVNFNSQTFAFYRGIFAKINTGNMEINLKRFKSYKGSVVDQNKTAKFVASDDSYYTHPAWRLS